jgi:hypothetical protein
MAIADQVIKRILDSGRVKCRCRQPSRHRFQLYVFAKVCIRFMQFIKIRIPANTCLNDLF